MGSYREYLIDKKTDWQQVQNEIAAALPQVKNPVNNVLVPTLTQLSGGGPGINATGVGTWGNTPGIPAPSPSPIDTQIVDSTPRQPNLVGIPERDVVSLAGESVDAATITNLLFENIGAVELTKFVRHDTVEGINQYYDIISNLSEVKRRFDPSKLISIQKPDSSNFDIYSIKLQDKIPDNLYLSNNNITDYVYFDPTNGDLIIEVVNMSESEIIEVQIDSNGTIYRIEES